MTALVAAVAGSWPSAALGATRNAQRATRNDIYWTMPAAAPV